VSETRYLSRPGRVGPESRRQQLRELETRRQALRGTVQEGERSFKLTGEHVERIHRRFVELGEQGDVLRCVYPFAGRFSSRPRELPILNFVAGGLLGTYT